MGADYINSAYRKDYDGDYVKAYEDRTAVKKDYAERVKSYKEITQKQGSYNKKEKGTYDPGNTERTIDILDKPVTQIKERRREAVERRKKTESSIKKVQEHKTITTIQSPIVEAYSTNAEVPKVEQKKILVDRDKKNGEKNTSNTRAKNLDYDVYRKMVIVPIVEEGSGVYREMKNKELVDEKEARIILDHAGFKKKADMEYSRFAIIVFAVAIVIGYVGAVIALAWAYFYKQRRFVVLEKNTSMSRLSIKMPASEIEQSEIDLTGNIYLYISVAMLVVAFLRKLFF